MTTRVSATLAICVLASAITIIGLFRSPDQPSAAAPEAVVESDEATPAVSTPPVVAIENFAFGGATTVRAGEQITVSNLDGAPHTMTADDGSFDTGVVDAGSNVTLTMPDAPGTYQYFCSLHPSMVSTITVEP